MGVESLRQRYGINHIRISAYNSQANGLVEWRHRDVHEALMKTMLGDESQWPAAAPGVFWVERITTQRATGHLPYFIAHGTEPLLPFDLAEATYLAPAMNGGMTTVELLAARGRMLKKRDEDLQEMERRVYASRKQSAADFEQAHRRTIVDFNFRAGALVLLRNSQTKMELNRKSKPRYLGPYVVVRKNQGGSYVLAELDGTVSDISYAGFRLLPYYARKCSSVPVASFVDSDCIPPDNNAPPESDDTSDKSDS